MRNIITIVAIATTLTACQSDQSAAPVVVHAVTAPAPVTVSPRDQAIAIGLSHCPLPVTEKCKANMANIADRFIAEGRDPVKGMGVVAEISALNKAGMVFKAGQVVSDYKRNTVSADAKYKGKRVVLDVTIDTIDTDIANRPILRAKTGGYGFNNPMLYVSDDTLFPLVNAEPGQDLMAICTGNGDIAKTPIFKDCVLG